MNLSVRKKNRSCLSNSFSFMPLPLPKHIAIIMDGNGRWAKAKGLPRFEGHRRGVEVVDDIVTAVTKLNISHLTLYAFSDENWNRPQEEIDSLMQLLVDFLEFKKDKMLQNGVRLKTIGDTSKLPSVAQKKLAETMEATAGGNQLTLILALSYGARDEMTRAMQKFLNEGVKNITEEGFSKYLDTKDYPDPDLLIRTSQEYRLSNFLLWQLAYTELYFTKTMWPDFTPEELMKAIKEFSKRERRFGKTSEQLS